ncbi:unnamed protein product, partial [Didymodactylos carnosus]
DNWVKDPNRARALSSLIKLYIENLNDKRNSGVIPAKMLTITTHTHTHLPSQCFKFGRLDWLENFIFESFLGFLKSFVKGSAGAGEQIAFGFLCNFALKKLNEKERFGYVIDGYSTSSSSVDSDEDEQMLNELLYNVKYDSDNRPVHGYTQYSVSELSIELLNFFRASRLPENLRKQLLKLVSKYMPVPNNIPFTTSEILCSVGLQKFYSNDRLCCFCFEKIVSGKCVNTSCKHSNEKLLSDESVNFIQFDMEFQVKVLCEQNILLLKRYQSEARDLSMSDSADIVGGDIYQNLLQTHESFFLSIMLHSDGVPLYNSKNCSGWPILGAVVELPPYLRTKAENILLLGLWIGRQKPNFHIIFEKLKPNLLKLKTFGVQISKTEHIKVLFPLLLGDMPALSEMVNFVLPNAYFACMFCTTKGVYSHDGHCITYPNDLNAEVRTHKVYDRYADSAITHSHNRDETAGIKGVSAFRQVLDVPLPDAIGIDGMHTVFLCHGKKLMKLIQSSMTKEDINRVSQKLRHLLYIHDIQRRPRGFDAVHKWKASEVRLFILYIGLPLLCTIAPEEVVGDFAMYVVIQRLLHDNWVKDPNRA